MEKILLQKLSHATMLLGCSNSVAAELNEYFSFYVPGYKFMPAFKNKVWDGKIRLFNSRSNTLPVGLFDHLLKFFVTLSIVKGESSYHQPAPASHLSYTR